MRSREAATQAGLVEVDLEVSSWLEGRGVRHTNWSVLIGDAWIPIGQLRSVAATLADPEVSFNDDVDEMLVIPPGCQYRKTYHPRLAPGTRLRKRVSAPLGDAPPARTRPQRVGELRWDFASALRRRLPLKTTFTDFRVDGPNSMISEERWQRREARAVSSPQPREAEESKVTVAELEAFLHKLGKQSAS